MAELNFGLLTPPGSQSIGNAFVSGMDQAAVARAQENQNALSQYTLSKARREDQVKSQLLSELRAAKTPDEQAQAYINAGMGKEAAEMKGIGLKNIKLQGDINAQPGLMARTAAQTDADKAKTVRENATYAYETISRLAALPEGATDQDITAAISDAGSRGLLSMQEATRVQTALLNATPEKRRESLLLMGADAAKRLQALTPDIRQVTTPTGSIEFKNFAPFSQGFGQTPSGFTNLAAGMTPYQTGSLGVSQGNLNVNRGRAMDEGISIPGVAAPANAMLGAQPAAAPANAMLGGQPVAPGAQQTAAPAATGGYSPKMLRDMAAKGMQPDGKGGQTFIPGGEKDPAAIVRLEAAKAEGAATGKDMVAAVRTLPNAIASSQKALANIDAMLGDARVEEGNIKFSKGKGPHPGFENAVGAGIGLRFIPGTDASDFQERFREITSGAFLEAFEALRGGGSITEKEGEKATAAKTRMSLAQSEKEFVTAAREYQDIIRVGVGRAQERLNKARGASAGNTGGGASGSWGKAVAE
jgi:hypothetical protein